MRKILHFGIISITLFAILFLQSCLLPKPVSAIVTFGTKPAGGGACFGNGICTACAPNSNSIPPDGIPVTFKLDPADKNILLIVYKLADLQAKQPEQALTISRIIATPPPGNTAPVYKFDAQYMLNDPMYGALALQGTPSIKTTTPITITNEATAGTITMHIKYEHAP